MAGRAHGVAGVLALLVAAGVWFMVNELLVTTAIWLRFGGGWRQTLSRTFRQEALSTLALLALGPVVVAAGNVSAALVPLMLIPLFTVNELARYIEQERRRSARDDLTGLPNRRALIHEMRSQARTYAERRSRVPGDRRRMALLLLDIDQFRHVNDALGTPSATACSVPSRPACPKPSALTGWWPGSAADEFLVLAPRLPTRARPTWAEWVADALAEPVTLDGLPLDVTAAIGWPSTRPRDRPGRRCCAGPRWPCTTPSTGPRPARSTRPSRTTAHRSASSCWRSCAGRWTWPGRTRSSSSTNRRSTWPPASGRCRALCAGTTRRRA
jgi:GGDEF domain-containing protein